MEQPWKKYENKSSPPSEEQGPWSKYTGKAEAIRGPLTAGERLQAIAKQTLRAAPTTAGMIGGGIGGFALGGVPGAIGGAGIGAGAGKEVELYLRRLFPNAMGGGESYEGDKSGSPEVTREILYGMAGEATGQVGAKVLPGLLKRNVSPEVMNRIDDLKTHKVPVSAGDYRSGGAAQQIENLAKGTMLGGRVIGEHDIASAKALTTWRNDFLNSVGKEFDDVKLGEIIKDSVEVRAASLFGKNGLFKKLYGKYDKVYPSPIDTTKIRAFASEELKTITP